jgi:hypothetical protein
VRQQDGGVHDFGYSATSTFAGGKSAGEVGGTIWRSGEYAYYADKVGPLSLNDKLEASGKVVLTVGPPDSGMYIGWFNGEEKELSPPQAGNFVGVKVGGPTRVGHYFCPAYATTQTKLPEQGSLQHEPNISIERDKGPVLTPLKPFDWKLSYDPAAADGKGAITVTLGVESGHAPAEGRRQSQGRHPRPLRPLRHPSRGELREDLLRRPDVHGGESQRVNDDSRHRRSHGRFGQQLDRVDQVLAAGRIGEEKRDLRAAEDDAVHPALTQCRDRVPRDRMLGGPSRPSITRKIAAARGR